MKLKLICGAVARGESVMFSGCGVLLFGGAPSREARRGSYVWINEEIEDGLSGFV